MEDVELISENGTEQFQVGYGCTERTIPPSRHVRNKFRHNRPPAEVTGYGVQRNGESGVNITDQGTLITDQKRRTSNDLFIDHYSFIMDIMKLAPAGVSITETMNHLLDTQDFSEVRWRSGITAAWKEHEIMCKKGAQWSVSKKWVSGRHSFVVSYYGPDNGEVFPGSHESSQSVLKSTYDVAREISKFVNGGE